MRQIYEDEKRLSKTEYLVCKMRFNSDWFRLSPIKTSLKLRSKILKSFKEFYFSDLYINKLR
jgi:hypothetical protein